MTSHLARICLVAALVAGCTPGGPAPTSAPDPAQATGGADMAPPTGTVAAAESPDLLTPPPDKARIVVFRGSTFGLLPNMTKPRVKIDDQDAGGCEHNSIIVRDLPAGTHELSMTTDVQARRTVTLAVGETVFVKCNILPIGVVLPAPALDLVPFAKVPSRSLKLARQP